MTNLAFPLLLLLLFVVFFISFTEMSLAFKSMGLKKSWVGMWLALVYAVGVILWILHEALTH